MDQLPDEVKLWWLKVVTVMKVAGLGVRREEWGGFREEEPLMPEATYTYNIRKDPLRRHRHPGGIFNFLFLREKEGTVL